MSSNVKALWPENVLQQKDSPVFAPIDLGPINGSLFKAFFISESEVALQYFNSVDIFSVKEMIRVHRVQFNRGIQQCCQLDGKSLIFRSVHLIALWDIPSRLFVCQWKGFPGTGDLNMRLSATQVGSDNFIVAHNKCIHKVCLKHRNVEGKQKFEIVKTHIISGWDDKKDRRLHNLFVHEEKIALITDDRLMLIDFTDGTLLFHIPLNQGSSVRNRVTLSGEYLVYFERATSQIVVRSTKTASTTAVSQSGDLSKLIHYHSNSSHDTSTSKRFAFSDIYFSVQGKLLLVNLVFRNYLQHRNVFIASSIDTGSVQYKYSSTTNFKSHTPYLYPHGLILPENKYISIATVSQELHNAAFPPDLLDPLSRQTVPETPLKTAYLACLQQEKPQLLHFCNQLITYDNCKKSFEEYFCAHRLLMLAIHDKVFESRTEHHDGEQYIWFESLYLAGRELEVCNTADRRALRILLSEAEKVGVIRDGEVILAALDMTREYRTHHKMVMNLGNEFSRRLIRLEDGHSSLVEAFERYKRVQGMTQLVGVAFNVIPFIGGAIASAVSAGVGVFEGLASGDVVTFGLEISKDLILESETMEKRLLYFVGCQLEGDNLEKLDDDIRKQLMSQLNECGATPEMLRCLFLNGAEEHYLNLFSTVAGSSSTIPSIPFEHVQYQKSSRFANSQERVTGKERDHQSFPEVKRAFVYDHHSKPHFAEREKEDGSNMYTPTTTTGSNMDLTSWTLEELEEFDLTMVNVSRLKRKSAAVLLAAFLCQYDSDAEDKFSALSDILLGCFREKDIDGLVLADRTICDASELAELIMDYIDSSKEFKKNAFLKGKVNVFLKKFVAQ